MKTKTIILLIIICLAIGAIGGVLGNYATLTLISDFIKKRGGTLTQTTIEKVKVEEESAIIDAIKKVTPSVVSIISIKKTEGLFFGVYEEKEGGTGFVITSDGLILTNKHVAYDKKASYTVLTSDGHQYKAKIYSMDPLYDLAILKIEAKNLPVVELGDSDELQIGQRVIAIGYALGEFQNTVTTGIVSAKNRSITASGTYGTEHLKGLIQTDAAINPGNSGGPLVNLKGQVVGVNVAVAQAENIGFAIPINFAKTAIESVIRTGKIARPYIGIRYVMITKEIASLNGLPVDYGALIYSEEIGQPAVLPGSAAAKAGLKEGDIILKINDEKIDENNTLPNILQQYKPGDRVEILYNRDGKEYKTNLTFGKIEG
jgi:S1-C subfamily serine protease